VNVLGEVPNDGIQHNGHQEDKLNKPSSVLRCRWQIGRQDLLNLSGRHCECVPALDADAIELLFVVPTEQIADVAKPVFSEEAKCPVSSTVRAAPAKRNACDHDLRIACGAD